MDRERRLTADHMRRLNQVLAGHLAYAEVPKVHASQDASGVLSPAPSHGSAVGSSTKGQRPSDGDFAGKRNPNGGVHGSHRQDTLQRLVRQARHLGGGAPICYYFGKHSERVYTESRSMRTGQYRTKTSRVV